MRDYKDRTAPPIGANDDDTNACTPEAVHAARGDAKGRQPGDPRYGEGCDGDGAAEDPSLDGVRLRAVVTLYSEAATDALGDYYAAPAEDGSARLDRWLDLHGAQQSLADAWAQRYGTPRLRLERLRAAPKQDPRVAGWLDLVVADALARLGGDLTRPLPESPAAADAADMARAPSAPAPVAESPSAGDPTEYISEQQGTTSCRAREPEGCLRCTLDAGHGGEHLATGPAHEGLEPVYARWHADPAVAVPEAPSYCGCAAPAPWRPGARRECRNCGLPVVDQGPAAAVR